MRLRQTVSQKFNRRSGFTLLELLIVLAIILVIAAMVVPNLVGSQQTANEKATLATIKQMEGAAGAYAADHDGVYLVASGTTAWNTLMNPGTYKGRKLKPNLGEIPLDAWGNPLQYEWNKGGGHSKNPNAIKPAIWSLGADKSGDGTNPNGIPLNNWTSMGADQNQK